MSFCDIENLVIVNKVAKFDQNETDIICLTIQIMKIMKKKILFAIGAILLFCSISFAQGNGGSLVELKPYNPPGTPPIGGLIPPNDTSIKKNPFSLMEQIIFDCYQNSTHLTLQCNNDERVNVIIYEMLSGVKHTSTLNMVAGETYTIATPWGTGLYTIRLTLSDGTILEGDFQIK